MHKRVTSELNITRKSNVRTVQDSVNSLQGELHELKQREKVYMETLKQSSNDEVQAAVACFQQLPLELDGLRVVLDMRTQDVHNLRGKIVELERQVSLRNVTVVTIKYSDFC
jgi:polyhydroxyalkanoate synthesis regulator phasin